MTPGTASPFVALGHYCILFRLRYGGMSEIYLAHDERLHRIVALKVVDMAREDHVERFRREVETLKMLSHEHILPIFDWGEQDGWCYFVMPYLSRGSLRDRLEQGPLTLEEAGSIFEQVVSALHYAHEQGVLHRDIKPSNILFGDERHVYLADFGLARLVGQEGGITRTGCLIGTAEYLAPELATKPADQRSDIYALGVLLYKMLTGKVPFQAGTPLALHLKHASEQPTRPSSLNPAIAPALERIILKALEKDPARRFRSAQQMAEAYRQTLRVLKHPRTVREWGISFSYRLRLFLVPAQALVRFLLTKLGKGRGLMFTRLYPATAACAMIMLLCIAPLCLGFSLSRKKEGRAESLIGLRVTTSYFDTQPLLQRDPPQPIHRTSLKSLFAFPDMLPTPPVMPSSLLYHQYAARQQQGTRRKQNQGHEQRQGQEGNGNGKRREGHGNGNGNGKRRAHAPGGVFTGSHRKPKGGSHKRSAKPVGHAGKLPGHVKR